MRTLILLFLCTISMAFGYRLLAVQTAPSKSHYNLLVGLVKPLLEAGHEITFAAIFPDKKPLKNLRVIDLSEVQKAIEHVNALDQDKVSFSRMNELMSNISHLVLNHPEVQHVMREETFDAVITEWLFRDVEAGYAAALQVPWILLHGMEMSPHMENLVDTVRHVPTIPLVLNDAPIPMNLPQRLMNTAWHLLMSFGFYKDFSSNEAEYHAMFGPIAEARGHQLPPYWDAIRDVSVLFLNSHPSFTAARSLPPNAVEIGGYHIDENVPPLPKDLQVLLDSSKNGVIYFSMGSVIKAKNLPENLRNELIKMFAELPYTVLWKFETELKDLPKNLHVRPWMPQPSILTHPNVKVFITHGGGLSTIESLYYGKPILAVPVFGDQPANAEQAVRAGRALKVPYSINMVGDLKLALKEMLSNDSYYQRAQFLSSLFHKRPVPPKQLVTSYVELAIESKGAHHLRSKTLLYKWYEIWMLDQAAVLLAVLYILYRVIKKIVCLIKGMFSRTKKVKKQ
ncbi:UDP-glucosyltransferase 2-like isoform X1 [Aricia agestis]|uniref:UDP-glucosyltransferase 2-like isoform X1 n=2 Tax=Aricia agestis TaxID=91739 RepID=UPI001C2064AC|nr:UDP-glucosyltransferase 2-like isoform X1 [Aricia agestis]